MAENSEKILETPKELERLYDLRKKLAGTDRDDHLAELDDWERSIKKSLIFLNLQKHEGITQLLKKADEELSQIEEVLRETRPLDLSSNGALAYTYESARLHDRRELWKWFKSLFEEAESDLHEAQSFLDGQEGEEEDTDPYKGK